MGTTGSTALPVIPFIEPMASMHPNTFPTLEMADDATLLMQLQTGDPLAFTVLVHRHSQRFYRLAYRVLQNQSAAEDIVQHAFLKLWEHPARWNPQARVAFTTWFYRVVVNLCLDVQKKKRPLPLSETIEVADASITQEETLLERERQRWLETHIAALPARQRTALTLCFYEECSNQEAATIMGVSLKALQSLIIRAKMTLKEALTHGLK